MKNKKVNCFPLGYKSGTSHKKNITERKYKWSFIGTPHKSSRHDLLFQLSMIKPSYSYKTKRFNDNSNRFRKCSPHGALREKFAETRNTGQTKTSFNQRPKIQIECHHFLQSQKFGTI